MGWCNIINPETIKGTSLYKVLFQATNSTPLSMYNKDIKSSADFFFETSCNLLYLSSKFCLVEVTNFLECLKVAIYSTRLDIIKIIVCTKSICHRDSSQSWEGPAKVFRMWTYSLVGGNTWFCTKVTSN